jgi:hypothetical protein
MSNNLNKNLLQKQGGEGGKTKRDVKDPDATKRAIELGKGRKPKK